MREPQLYRKSAVDALGNPDLWDRIQNKPKGGRAADDGGRMEHFYAVYKLIEIGAEIINDEARKSDLNEPADVTKYTRCLVDDLRIRNLGQTTFYQLKWGRVRLAEVLFDASFQSKLYPPSIPVSYKVVVRTKRRATVIGNRATAASIPLTPELFPFAEKWRRFSDVNPSMWLAMVRLAGNSNENRYEALFRTISAKWKEEDDVYVRQFIFEVWKSDRGLFVEREFAPDSVPIDENARNFEIELKALGFSAAVFPQPIVLSGSMRWEPIDPCDEEFFAEFMNWLACSPRSNGDIIVKLWEMKK